MNYAIIRKEQEKNNFFRPYSAEKIKIGENNIIFLSSNNSLLLKVILLALKPSEVINEDSAESPPILEFLVNRFSNITICAEPDKTLSILKKYASCNVNFFIPNDNFYVISTALKSWGIPVFVSPGITNGLLLYFGGKLPQYSENTFVADFSDKYVHNTINTENITNISFKTYTALYKIIGEQKIKSVS